VDFVFFVFFSLRHQNIPRKITHTTLKKKKQNKKIENKKKLERDSEEEKRELDADVIII
jgi:hypothetical protein